jgi:hypothetical protein
MHALPLPITLHNPNVISINRCKPHHIFAWSTKLEMQHKKVIFLTLPFLLLKKCFAWIPMTTTMPGTIASHPTER